MPELGSSEKTCGSVMKLYHAVTAFSDTSPKREHECAVVAPSLIPRKPGAADETDRRDANDLGQAAPRR